MRELSLFTGAGGGLLGSLILGWSTIAAVECDPYCQRLLCARGGYVANAGCPSVQSDSGPREARGADSTTGGAVRQVVPVASTGAASQDGFPVYPDVRTFHPVPGSCDIVTGGFPCQPFSQAGKRLGEDDPRNMWPHAVRVLRESGASLGFFENVPGLLSSGYFGTVLGDLAEAGFDAEWCVLGADDVGAPHRRKRLWILAYAHEQQRRPVLHEDEQEEQWRGRPGDAGSPWWCDPADVGDAAIQCDSGRLPAADSERSWTRSESERDGLLAESPGADWATDPWLAQPYVGRVAAGVASRVDRLRALGNGQVPQTMAAAFTYLAREAGVLGGADVSASVPTGARHDETDQGARP